MCFQLVSSLYEQASVIMTSNLPSARWGDVFRDLTIASAMIDRIVHHADVIRSQRHQLSAQKTITLDRARGLGNIPRNDVSRYGGDQFGDGARRMPSLAAVLLHLTVVPQNPVNGADRRLRRTAAHKS